jgi:MFS family permease
MLTLVYTLNFVDRILIGVVAKPIIEEFKLLDWQFGLLSGFGFALMYTIIGIPIARMAESMNRVRIIAACVVLWSVMTALCGLATGFLSLLLFRVGVGIGEAGCTPPANSVIADYYSPSKRAKALGIYGIGVTLGGVLANLFGGPITEALSWREAFIYLGVPGVLVGIIVWLTVEEPPRGATDPPGGEPVERSTFKEALAELASKPTYWVMSASATAAAFVGYGVSNFTAVFFGRAHGLSVGEIATDYAVPIGLASTFGAFGGGWLTEKLSARSANAVAWVPAWGFVLCVPCYWIGFNTDDLSLALPTLMAGGMLHYAYLGAQYTIGQGVVGARTRATAIAILLFLVNLIGYGLGPLFVGALSDFLTGASLAGSEFGSELALTACKGEAEELLATIGAAKAAACGSAAAVGIRGAMSYTICIYLLAGAGFFATCRTLQKDLVAKMN